MGTIKQLAEDFYTCTLCLDKLKDPRTLPCLHSFCHACLVQYTAKAHGDWIIVCPVCEHEVDGNKQGLQLASVEQWLETFVPNAFIATVSKIKAARASEKACDICRQEHVLVEATMWCMECLEMLCDDCHRVHRRSKASRDHNIISVDALQNESLEKLIRPSLRPLMCPAHKDKVITMVCVDCKSAVCETCIVLSHAKCRRLEQLETVSPNLRYDMQEAKRRVDLCRQSMMTSGHGVTDQLATLTQSKDTALDEVRQLRDKLIELVVKKEEKAANQIETAYARQRDILTKRKRSCDLGHMALGKTSLFIDNLIALGNEIDILRNFDAIVKHVNLLEKEQSSNFQRLLSTVLKFTPEKRSADYLKQTSALGEIKLSKGSNRSNPNNQNPADTKAAVASLPPKNQKKVLPQKQRPHEKTPRDKAAESSQNVGTPKPKLLTSFTGRCNSDTMKTDLKGVIVLSDGSLVVMDVQFRNKRLKKFNHRGKLISHADPGDCPSSMALVPESDIVVSLPKVKEFAFVSAGGTLHVTGRIKTSKSYFSLSSSPDGVIAALALSAPETPAVDLISFNGELLQSIPLDRIRFPLPPKDIVLTPCGMIYMIFSGKETLVALNYQGEITMTFKSSSQHGIKRAISVDCDELDNAYIADVDAHKVHIVSSDGQYKGELVHRKDGLLEPLALYRTDEGSVAVTQASGDVKMFLIPHVE